MTNSQLEPDSPPLRGLPGEAVAEADRVFYLVKAMDQGDWICLHRKLENSEVFSNPKALKVWVWLLMRANWRVGIFKGQKVERGELVTSFARMSEALEMNRSTVWYTINWLQDRGMIQVTTERKWSKITICNYGTYQDRTADSRTQLERNLNANRTQLEPIEQENNVTKKPRTRKNQYVFMAPPTVEEVAEYCVSRNNSVDPEAFVAYYSTRGWKHSHGNIPMTEWKSAVITWEKRLKQQQQPTQQPSRAEQRQAEMLEQERRMLRK